MYGKLKEACGEGFLVNREAYLFLLHIRDNLQECEKYFPAGFVFKHNNPLQFRKERPKSGDFFLLDTRSVRLWKKDQHEWVMRPNDRYKVSESRTMYKIKGKAVMYGRRNRGAGGKKSGGAKLQAESTPETMIRYAYSLVKQPRYMLIHYFDQGLSLSFNVVTNEKSGVVGNNAYPRTRSNAYSSEK